MNKPVKYTLVGLGALVLVVIAGAVVFAMTFDPNRYKGEIERIAKEQTGRTLSIKGDIKMAFWPSLGADVAGVTFSDVVPSAASSRLVVWLSAPCICSVLLPPCLKPADDNCIPLATVTDDADMRYLLGPCASSGRRAP
jgi:hypothetical protein